MDFFTHPLTAALQSQGLAFVEHLVPKIDPAMVGTVELTEAFLAQVAGWEVMKRARAYCDGGQALSSAWEPPVLRGVVQDGSASYRAGLVIKSVSNVENLCHCRASQDWGKICAHSIAVGLHHVRGGESKPAAAASIPAKSTAPVKPPHFRLQRASDGEPLELKIIFPPNLKHALERGAKVMLCLEGKWCGGDRPLIALPKTQTFSLGPQDTLLLEAIETLAGGETPAMVLVDQAEFVTLLPMLVDHPRLTLGKGSSVAVTLTPWPVKLRALLEANGEILLSAAGSPVKAPLIDKSWVLNGNMLQPVGLPQAYMEVLSQPVRLSRAQVPSFLNQHWTQLSSACEIDANFTLDRFQVESQPPQFLLYLAGGLARLQARLQCSYVTRVLTPGDPQGNESLWMPDPNSSTRYLVRDLAAERQAINQLVKAGFTGPDANRQYEMLGQDAVFAFFASVFPRLQKQWHVEMEERLERSTQQQLERIEPRFEITPSGVQWFDFNVSFSSSGGDTFSAAEIHRLLRSGQSHTRLRNGKTALIDTGAVEELQQVLLDCSPQQENGVYKISNTQAGFVQGALQDQGWHSSAPQAWRERVIEQTGDINQACPPLGPLDGVLRPYQKEGVAWLHFLRRNGFGGILADEMGLGKTLQALALLSTLRQQDHSLPSLVVCPTSLVPNWVAEAARFAPQLRVLALHGPGRQKLMGEIPGMDLVVTSYALVRRDAEHYRDIEFDTVILDEAQHIKNRQTQNAQAVKSVRSRHRLVLTGTPLENSVLDLWSIFDFLMPGYLGSAQDFRERYEAPISHQRDGTAQARLARRLKPFLLRRLKRDVAADLPAKLEQVSFCELTSPQRAVYQQVLQASRKEVLDSVGAQGLARSRMVVLTALLRLRQVCCDLRLLPLEGIDPATASGKTELFAELLEEVLDGGHRVLVFSQFVSMLTLLRERLQAQGIEYCYLDGSTRDRAGVINKFQATAEIPVFLISLKAGGVGLNLTGADTVIHFDPWWNPAVEDQATDRAHRIGQTKIVTSYKLITRDTVEEKILQLQERKRGIIQATLAGEEQLSEALTWEELQDLLAG